MNSKKKDGKGKSDVSKKVLLEELQSLIRRMDEEQLLFLIGQAKVLQYNKSAREYNRKVEELRRTNKSAGKKYKPPDHEVEIVEKDGGEHFYIVIKGIRIYFTRDEMRSIVRICHASEDEKDASGRLYNWLSRNRKDLLIDGQIGKSSHPSLASIYRQLVSTYKVKEKS